MWNLGHESYFGIALISLHSGAARGLYSALSVTLACVSGRGSSQFWPTDFQAFSIIIVVSTILASCRVFWTLLSQVLLPDV